jgi:prepilin-type N-terminal cleavage/methylation domain-containing protein
MALAKFTWTAERQAMVETGRDLRGDAGFSILEVMVATTILSVSLAALAQLFVMSTQANTSARTTGYASVLAQQKMEQLRGLTFGFDNLGLPITDFTTKTTTADENVSNGKGLTPSPAKTLGKNVDGYCDFIDQFGNVIGGGTIAPSGTIYIRRWSIEPLPTNPNNTLVLQVLVTRSHKERVDDNDAAVKRLPDEARIISVKTRKAS